MLKKIDKLGRIVIPEFLRKEIGIELDDYVDIAKQGDSIVITKGNKMLSQDAIKHVLNVCKENSTGSDYDKGYIDALNYVLGEKETNGSSFY